MIDNNQRKKIMHRRWSIVAIITLILITWLHLWSIVFAFLFCLLLLYLFMRGIDWLTGADIDKHNLREVNKYRAKKGLPPAQIPDEHGNHEVSDTLGDIFTLNQIFNHHKK